MGQSLGEAITIIAYNLDYDGYRYIQTYGPVIHEMEGGNMLPQWTREPTTDRRIVDRCVAFAIDAALRLQGRPPQKIRARPPRRFPKTARHHAHSAQAWRRWHGRSGL